ncbi:MAG: hypothetical protein HC843_14280 [Sphingomonadales bacterium]|nr:hypothetical protein [Sphingomonadales bacterium]
MSLFANHLPEFSVPPGESHLLRSQVAAYKKQIPLMYLIVDANVLALSFTHFLTAPYWLTLLIPALLVVASLFRMVGWWRVRNDQITDAYAAQVLRSTNIFAVILGCGFGSWALALYPYGDVFAQMHVVFFRRYHLCCLRILPDACAQRGVSADGCRAGAVHRLFRNKR